jgi:hypothetical protein
MPSLVYRISALLCHVVTSVPVGTNLGLFHLLWTLLSGRLLSSRGAVIPALWDTGLAADAVRRAWAALTYGRWGCPELLEAWQEVIEREACWQPHSYGGYRPLVCDLVGFFRPHLKGCATKHYTSAAGKALPAIVLGVLVRVGSIQRQRLAVPCAFVRAEAEDHSEADLQIRLLEQAGVLLAPEEALVSDRGFAVAQVQAAGVGRFVIRGPKNFTARRAYLPAYKGRGRKPIQGVLVRPLARQRKGKVIESTPPDRVETWCQKGCIVRAEFWDTLVPSDAKPGTPSFSCVVIHDPRYKEPLLLLSNLSLRGRDYQGLYRDRWPVEQLPLSAKQMLGAARQFVFAPESRQRLPELSLLAGSVLSYVAATQPALPTGFWDRVPKATSGRLRRVLARVDFSDLGVLPAQVRKKPSPTAHLSKGVLAHRRRKALDLGETTAEPLARAA